ncbi:MAG: carboxypeptidase regulatory-like domain-containing protein [Planctomycetes bacterium]|nr:carboxypeptidase regulatory-like domain-containing protein [Planctomycetota bacterium]
MFLAPKWLSALRPRPTRPIVTRRKGGNACLQVEQMEARIVPAATITGIAFQDFNANGIIDTTTTIANNGASSVFNVATVSVASGGTGYTLGQVLTVSGGAGTAAQFKVSGVTGGVINAVTIANLGNYTTTPGATVGVGGGGGATFNVTYQMDVISAAVDVGVANITVRAIDPANNVQFTTTTGANGSYTLSPTDIGNTNYRIEFSSLPAGFVSGPHGPATAAPNISGTATQFVSGSTSNVNFGIARPEQYSSNNPTIITSINYTGPSSGNGSLNAIVSFPYSAGQSPILPTGGLGTNNFSAPAVSGATLRVPASSVGTIFGLTWDPTVHTADANRNYLYASAMFKAQGDYGPGGADAIYQIKVAPNGTFVSSSTFVNLDSLATGASGGNLHNGSLSDNTPTQWDGVGKSGLGGMDISADGKRLYVMALGNRTLYEIGSDPTDLATYGKIVAQFDIGAIANTIPGATGGGADIRPWAVRVFNGQVYVGMVNTAQATGARAQLRFYIYKLDSALTAGSFTQVLEVDGMTWTRQRANPPVATGSADWLAWVGSSTSINGSFTIYPQPMLTDLSFTPDGNVSIGFRDRAGDQTPPNNSRVAGDVLRAFINGAGTYQLENNGTDPVTGATTAGTGQAAPMGPGGGQWYFQNDFPQYHDHTPIGAILQVPGFADVLSTAFDPIRNDGQTFQGGIRWGNNTTGVLDKAYRIYVDGATRTFGKTNGMGGLTYERETAPVEIGNRVWDDANANGIQDPGEADLAGVVVGLYAPGAGPETAAPNLLATATTDGNGNYYFSSDKSRTNTASQIFGLTTLTANTNGYVVAFQPPAGKVPTFPGKGTNREIDSNPTYVTGPGGTFVTAKVDIGEAGRNDHSIDAGFFAGVAIGDFVWEDLNADGDQDPGEPGIPGVVLTLSGAGAIQTTATTDANGAYLFTEFPGTYTVSITSPGGGYTPTVLGKGTAATDSNDTTIANPTTPGAALAAGETDFKIDFGYYQPLSLGDFVFVDANNNGVFDGTDTGIVGVAVTLLDKNGNPAKDATNTVVPAQNTIAGGKYLFTNLLPGDYKVQITAPTGYISSTGFNNSGSFEPGSADYTTTGNDKDHGTQGAGLIITSTPVTLNAAGSNPDTSGPGSKNANLNVDFGIFQPLSLGNRVFIDADNNGKFDNSDTDLLGATVVLLDKNGVRVKDATGTDLPAQLTGANGLYLFTNLVAGDYKVQVTPPAVQGYVPSTSVSSDYTTVTGNDKNHGSPSAGGTSTTSAVNLSVSSNPDGGGFANLNVDLSFYRPLSVGNRVFVDADNNGVFNAGDADLQGATVSLLDSTGKAVTDLSGATVVDQTTGINGDYLFTNLLPGDYTVKVTPPAGQGYVPSTVASNDYTTATGNDKNHGTASAGGTSTTGAFTLQAPGGNPDNSGLSNLNVDLSFYQPLSLGDFVFVDANNNGVFDGTDTGIVGVAVTLLDKNGNPAKDATNTVVLSQNTIAGGKYLFTNLLPGDYKVQITAPAGYFSSSGSFEPGSSDYTTTGNNTDHGTQGAGTTITSTPVTLNAAGSNPDTSGPGSKNANLNVDFGIFQKVTIGDFVWNDLNANGKQDGGLEVGIQNVKVNLKNSQGVVIDSVNTDGAGAYLFTELPGTYTVEIDPSNAAGALAGYFASPTGATGDPTNDSNGNGSGTVPPTLLSGGSDLTIDFGFYKKVTIGDFVWNDKNGNGIQDGGDLGIDGVTITLTGTNGAGIGVSHTATTASGGLYLFTEDPGTYTITIDAANFGAGMPLVGLISTVTGQGTTATDSNTSPSGTTPATLPGGSNDLDLDFGFRVPPQSPPPPPPPVVSSLAGTVYQDPNNDGIKQGSEPGIGGVTVTLTNVGTGATFTTTTAADGTYKFSNLPAGTYRVDETQPAGFGDGKDAPGTSGGTLVAPDTINTINLGTNVDATGYNFGELVSSIAGLVYQDLNNDGIHQSTEPPIPGVTVTLFNATTGSLVGTTTTAADGTYLFSGLLGAKYRVVETQPTAFGDGKETVGSVGGTLVPTDTIDAITLPTGVAATGYNFGELLTGVSGTVFVDRNKDGNFDPGEPPIPGVTITLRDGTGTVVGTTTTDVNGFYNFPNLPPGKYTITETQPAGYGDPPAGTFAPNVRTVTLVGGTSVTDQDFGDTLSSLAGLVYVDSNDDGIHQTAEAIIPGVTVKLFDVTSGALVATTTTGADGTYKFNDLFAGKYRVVETQPTAFADGKDSVGSVGGTLVPTDTIDAITLPVNTDAVEYNFGELIAGISGKVFLDVNKDGNLQPGENPIPGVTITLTDPTGKVVATTTTDSTGFYSFPNLLPGTYTITETQPVQYGDPPAGPFAPNTRTVTLGTTPITNQNFGDTPGGLSGLVYQDLNNDGIHQPTEPVIPGVTVTLFNDTTGTTAGSTVTAADGTYHFTLLPAGTYRVVETQPVAFNDGKDTPGSVGGTRVPTDTISTIALPPGILATDYNFGELLPVTNRLSGTVYYDKNQDKVYQPSSDAPLPNITVTLRNAAGVVVGTKQTNPDGTYSFSNLPAGTYTITETQPTGYGSSQVPLNVRTVTMTPTANITKQDFGDTLGTISGKVYLDYNLSGAFNTVGVHPDTGISGITVTLRNGAGGIVGQVKTDANGNYRFTDLRPGTYTVRETQPPKPTSLFNGYYDGADNLGTLGGAQPQKNALRLVLGLDPTTKISQNGRSYNFGELPPADPNGFVYFDANRNGIKDPGEKGIANVAITISGTAFVGTIFARPITGADVPGGSLTVFTDANGFYQFNPIPPGVYTIREAQPAGFLDGLEQNGDPTQPLPTVGNDVFSNIRLDPFPVRGPFNFGEILPLPGTPSKRGLLGSMI